MLSQPFFFVISPKIGTCVVRFSRRVLQCCPTVFGRLCFFVCGTGRQPIQRDKTVNDNYYLLTLAAIAKEIK